VVVLVLLQEGATKAEADPVCIIVKEWVDR